VKNSDTEHKNLKNLDAFKFSFSAESFVFQAKKKKAPPENLEAP